MIVLLLVPGVPLRFTPRLYADACSAGLNPNPALANPNGVASPPRARGGREYYKLPGESFVMPENPLAILSNVSLTYHAERVFHG